MSDGARKARLNDTRREWFLSGLYIRLMRGEKKGSSRLPNLSTRTPADSRHWSTKYSSCRYAPNSFRSLLLGASVMSKLFRRALPP